MIVFNISIDAPGMHLFEQEIHICFCSLTSITRPAVIRTEIPAHAEGILFPPAKHGTYKCICSFQTYRQFRTILLILLLLDLIARFFNTIQLFANKTMYFRMCKELEICFGILFTKWPDNQSVGIELDRSHFCFLQIRIHQRLRYPYHIA